VSSSEDISEQVEPTVKPWYQLRYIWILLGVAACLLVADVVSKYLVVKSLENHPPKTIIDGVLYFHVIRNAGAAFSFATGMTWVFSLVMIVVIGVIIWITPRLRSIGWALGLGLVLAGATGNLLDRIFRSPGVLRGHVVDFISLFGPDGGGFAIFNVADSGITVGAVVIVLMVLLGRDYDGTATKKGGK
jgi:signal peptidase II